MPRARQAKASNWQGGNHGNLATGHPPIKTLQAAHLLVLGVSRPVARGHGTD